jgi:hypothetical protein
MPINQLETEIVKGKVEELSSREGKLWQRLPR